MKKTFLEYQVTSEQINKYRAYMEEKRRLWPDMEWLESQEQPGLFLEIHVNAEEAFITQRKTDSELIQWVEQGKVRCWNFRTALSQDR